MHEKTAVMLLPPFEIELMGLQQGWGGVCVWGGGGGGVVAARLLQPCNV